MLFRIKNTLKNNYNHIFKHLFNCCLRPPHIYYKVWFKQKDLTATLFGVFGNAS